MAVSPGGIAVKREAEHLSTSIAQVKNGGAITSHPLTSFVFIARYLIKHRDNYIYRFPYPYNFTFTFKCLTINYLILRN
jgi:hypothetical protein